MCITKNKKNWYHVKFAYISKLDRSRPSRLEKSLTYAHLVMHRARRPARRGKFITLNERTHTL